MDTEGWIAVSAENVSYASLIGLPVSIIPKNATAVLFDVETSYWWLTCPVLVGLWDGYWNDCNVTGASHTEVSGWYQTPRELELPQPGMWLASVFGYQHRHLPNSSTVGDRPVMYCNPDGSLANCSIANSYVEARVSCKGVECAVSTYQKIPCTESSFQLVAGRLRIRWMGLFLKLLGEFPGRILDINIRHLSKHTWLHPDDHFNHGNLSPAHEILTTSEFGLGLSQIFHSCWSAIVGQRSIETDNQNPDLNKTAT